MATGRFVSYLRVSTQRQGQSGLGLEAQRHAVDSYLNGGSWELLAEFVETESGRKNDRPQLAAAMETCRRHKATLVIAKLDRLSRNAAFLLGLRDSKVDFVACDMPQADRFTVGILALVAEREAEMISQRTKAALAAAKRRGAVLGNPQLGEARERALKALKGDADNRAQDVMPVIRKIQKAGITTMAGIAQSLNALGVKTARGGRWHGSTVHYVMKRLKAA